LTKGKGKSIGIFADTIEQANRWISAGCQFIAYSVDVGIFSNACTKLVSKLNDLRK
jgi:4-hydroxy-2-oxoheptanedioate aldolase